MMHSYETYIFYQLLIGFILLLFTPFVIGLLLYIFAQQYTSFKDTGKDNMVVRNNFR